VSHSVICEAVSICRTLRRTCSRSKPAGRNFACSRRRVASASRRCSRDWVCLRRLRLIIARLRRCGAGTQLAFSSPINAYDRAVMANHWATKSDGATTKVKRALHGELICSPALTPHINHKKQSDILRENAENCLKLAEGQSDQPALKRYKRMSESWLALAKEQD
jgi:hypothetical protein